MSRPPVVFILGPTASGKTGLAIDLVEHFDAEIVSVDSAMVYRGMDIGTAKPDSATLARAPHALIDIRDPADIYSAADFVADARREIDRIHAAGRLPLLTGGTSLYFRALEHGLSQMPGRDDAIRADLTAEAKIYGWRTLHARLSRLDPATAARIHPNDAQRIQRMLEVHALTGQRPSELRGQRAGRGPAWPITKLVVAPPSRERLHQNIAMRFDRMMADGLLAEVEKLHACPDLDSTKPSMRAAGYRQLWQSLDGVLSLDEAVQRAIVASRQLAKRQLTWLRSLDEATWLVGDEGETTAAARRIMIYRLRRGMTRANIQ